MKPKGFEWDSGNQEKNRLKHGVTERECEEAFGDLQAIIMLDDKHSAIEKRFIILGVTIKRRKLAVIYTYRNGFIRIISARDQSKIERRLYEEKAKTN